MRFTLLAYGSRGDIQPYIALALGLQRAGHSVRLAAPHLFADFVTGYGLEFAPLAGDPTQLVQGLVERGGWNPFRVARVIIDYTLPLARQIMAGVQAACQGTDAIIHSFLLTLAGHQAACEAGVPDFSAQILPIFTTTAAFPSPAFPVLPLGSIYNRLTHAFFNQSFWQGSRLAYNWTVRRQDPSLPPLTGWPFSPAYRPRPPLFYGISPHILPPPAGAAAVMTGYWFLEKPPAWQPPADLADFLASGPPPVYIGFGSMITRNTGHLLDVILAALAQTGQRAILLSGWGGLSRADLPPMIYPAEHIPHDWLFPQMAAIVHHGGAGTTAAALRAGVPSIIIPFTSDQPFWGWRVHHLGAGPQPIPHRRLTPTRLAQALTQATTSPAMQARAATLGRRIRAEDGVGRAVELIQTHLTN